MFSDRIRRRHRLFWNTRRLTLHGKGRCLLTHLDRDTPLERWHCCDLWQRKLANKWNSREFAAKHGCRVPELYWSGKRVREIPFGELPERYVLRPTVGHSRQGVYVMANGVHLGDWKPCTPAELVAEMARRLPPWTRRRYLVEEFVAPDDPRHLRPVEIKCYTFGDRIASIQYLERSTSPDAGWTYAARHYDEDWQPLPALHIGGKGRRVAAFAPRPACLDEILEQARTLGRAYGTFVRIDFYASAKGAVFGEFAATPFAGERTTAYGDPYLERVWGETFPDAI